MEMLKLMLKMEKELNWRPNESFLTGIKKTVEWYVANIDRCYNAGSSGVNVT